MDWRHQRGEILAAEMLDELIQTTGILFERVVGLEDGSDLFELHAGWRWNEESGERSVIAVELLVERRDTAMLPQKGKEHALLDGDVAEQTATERVVRVGVTVAETADEQLVEPLVVRREEAVQFGWLDRVRRGCFALAD